jgi:4a-hydroxytetrahydrobiopterin dehydratase
MLTGMVRTRLDDATVAARLAQTDGWALRDGAIARSFRFATYAQGVRFTDAVAEIAERLDHHPDILLGYARVEVRFSTHDVGGISPRDFDAAHDVDALARGFEGLAREG